MPILMNLTWHVSGSSHELNEQSQGLIVAMWASTTSAGMYMKAVNPIEHIWTTNPI